MQNIIARKAVRRLGKIPFRCYPGQLFGYFLFMSDKTITKAISFTNAKVTLEFRLLPTGGIVIIYTVGDDSKGIYYLNEEQKKELIEFVKSNQ